MAATVLVKRFEELAQQLATVEATRRYETSEYFAGDRIDHNLFLNWRVKARNLLARTCGEKSAHYQEFLNAEKPDTYKTPANMLDLATAVFNAAREDFEGGFLVSVRSLIQAEVFSTEIDQARELLEAGYAMAAAVIAGVVLETSLRQLCNDKGLATGKLDKMNAELAKAGTYNLLVQKRITALADVRNNAAHGHSDRFAIDDVQDMISYTERFTADHP